MPLDFKREYCDLYVPKTRPALVDVPAMTFAAVAGTGDPNEEGGAYGDALSLLYGFSYAVKMLKMGDWRPEGYFDYVVPPLEGLWWAGAGAFDGTSIADKGALSWVSLIRQPDFVTHEVFETVCGRLAGKKPELAPALERGDLRIIRFAEGRCAQVMHVGPYDDELASLAKLRSSSTAAACARTSRKAGSPLRATPPPSRSTPGRCSVPSMRMAGCRRSASTMKSISATRAAPSPRTSRPSSGIRCGYAMGRMAKLL